MSELAGYLRRLGLDRPLPPTLETLRVVQRAHVARIPYDNLSIMLGRPDPVDRASCLARVAGGGRLGYCLAQNTALEWLLSELGFSVSRRHGHVWTRPEHQLDTDLNHLLLVVSGLPTDDNPGGHWWADVGLGEGFAEPLPIVRGEHEVEGWTFGIGAGFGAQASGRPTGPAAWTYRHLPGGAFSGIVVTARPHDDAAVEAAHVRLSTSEDSPFRRVLVAQLIDGPRLSTLRGCVHTVMSPDATGSHDVASYDEWRDVLAGPMQVPLDDVAEAELRGLWDRTLASHRAWDSAGRP